MFADLWMKRQFNTQCVITGYLARQKEVRTVEASSSSPHLELGQVYVCVVLCGFQKLVHPLIRETPWAGCWESLGFSFKLVEQSAVNQ